MAAFGCLCCGLRQACACCQWAHVHRPRFHVTCPTVQSSESTGWQHQADAANGGGGTNLEMREMPILREDPPPLPPRRPMRSKRLGALKAKVFYPNTFPLNLFCDGFMNILRKFRPFIISYLAFHLTFSQDFHTTIFFIIQKSSFFISLKYEFSHNLLFDSDENKFSRIPVIPSL